MAKFCAFTGRQASVGGIIHRKGQSKKSGGIGTHVTKVTKRLIKPNLQRIRVLLESGEMKRLWVSVKAIKSGMVRKV